MLKCSKCGNGIPSGSRFCLACGAAIERPDMEKLRLHTEQPKKKSWYWAAAAAGVLALIILAILLSRGRVAEAPTPVLQHAPVVTAPPPGPPQAIIDYLAHVQRIEELRNKMRNDFNPALKMLQDVEVGSIMPDEDTQQETQTNVQQGMGDYTKQFQEIVAKFNEMPAPQGCEKLASTYADALGKYSSTIINIQLALHKRDLSALMSMRGDAQAEVDASLIAADQELANVCKTYEIEKNFSITPDRGVTNLLSTLK